MEGKTIKIKDINWLIIKRTPDKDFDYISVLADKELASQFSNISIADRGGIYKGLSISKNLLGQMHSHLDKNNEMGASSCVVKF